MTTQSRGRIKASRWSSVRVVVTQNYPETGLKAEDEILGGLSANKK
jgi:hypothetical protein